MSPTDATEHVTQLLESIRQGHASAADRLLPLLYDELHRMYGLVLSHHRRLARRFLPLDSYRG